METRVVVDEIDLTTATSLKELLESSGIAVELVGGQSRLSRHAADGRVRPAGAGARYDGARRLVDELELEAGQEPPRDS